MKELLIVFLGGGAGSCCRFLCSACLRRWSEARWGGQWPAFFPWGTLLVNVLGCLLIGFCYGLAVRCRLSADVLLLLTTGFCGGFTTFSTFSFEMLGLLRSGQGALFALYAALSLGAGLAAVWAGHRVASFF